MKKLVSILMACLFVLALGGCSGDSSTSKSKIEVLKSSITQEELNIIKNKTNVEVFNDIKKRHNVDDLSVAAFYKHAMKLNEEMNQGKCLYGYYIPMNESFLYGREELDHIIKANCKLDYKFVPKNKGTLEECIYTLSAYNKEDSEYIIKPKVYLLVRDRLTKMPVKYITVSLDELKPGKSDSKDVYVPLGECEMIPESVYSIPEKLTRIGIIFDDHYFKDFPEKQNSEKIIPEIATGVIVNDKASKKSDHGSHVYYPKGFEEYKYFKKGTKVIVLAPEDSGKYFVSDGLGGYTFVDAKDIKIDAKYQNQIPFIFHRIHVRNLMGWTN